jgi:hypothetical protein
MLLVQTNSYWLVADHPGPKAQDDPEHFAFFKVESERERSVCKRTSGEAGRVTEEGMDHERTTQEEAITLLVMAAVSFTDKQMAGEWDGEKTKANCRKS